MATGTKKTIDEIDDIVEMVQVMNVLKISSKGLKTLDQMKDKVKTSLRQTKNKRSWTARKVTLDSFLEQHLLYRAFQSKLLVLCKIFANIANASTTTHITATVLRRELTLH